MAWWGWPTSPFPAPMTPSPGSGTVVDVLFLTNNSSLTRGDVLAKLARAGVEADPEEVLTSATAAAAAARVGARFVATNRDATYPTPDGPTARG